MSTFGERPGHVVVRNYFRMDKYLFIIMYVKCTRESSLNIITTECEFVSGKSMIVYITLNKVLTFRKIVTNNNFLLMISSNTCRQRFIYLFAWSFCMVIYYSLSLKILQYPQRYFLQDKRQDRINARSERIRTIEQDSRTIRSD